MFPSPDRGGSFRITSASSGNSVFPAGGGCETCSSATKEKRSAPTDTPRICTGPELGDRRYHPTWVTPLHPDGRNADGEGARQRSEGLMTTAIIGLETSEARWRGISSAAASASCWPSGESQAAARIGRRHTMTSEPTVMRLGESVPCPSCSRRFGKVHADLARTACRGRRLIACARRCCARCSPHRRRDPRPDRRAAGLAPACARASLAPRMVVGERVDTRPGIRKRAGPTLPGARMIWSCLRNRSRAGDERTPGRARLG
jgi:hypothetical protein